METINTIIADSQKMFVTGLISVLKKSTNPQINITDVAKDAAELKEILKTRKADLLLLELNLPDEDGLELLPELKVLQKDIKICVLTNYDQTKFVKEAFQKGADGYLAKFNDFEDFFKGIEEVMDGNTFLGNGLRITPANNGFGKSAKITRKPASYEDRFLIKQKLTSREHEVLELITQAKNNKEIAKELFISDQTVGVHRKNSMRKLGVRNTINLIKFAMEHQLV